MSMGAYKYNHPGCSKIYTLDFSVIREMLMNKHMLKYIHFIRYTSSVACRLEQER